MSNSQPILVYGAMWCPDCRRTKQFLDDNNISYEWHDTDADPAANQIVLLKNNGRRVIPTVVFNDGTFVSEPSDRFMAEKLGIDSAN